MAAIARPKLRENGGRPMSKKLTATVASVGSGKVPAAPVKVKLKRVKHCLKRVRSRLTTAANCSGTAAEQWDLRDRCECQLGVHRGRQAPG